MAHIYDYENNISVVTTPSGDKVITMNEVILTFIENTLHDGAEYHREINHEATANEIIKLWKAIIVKDDEASANNEK